MKKISIKYNPYLVETTITVDDEKPKANSALNVGKKRLQEWIEKLPDILLDEYRDPNLSISFTGSSSDFDDIKMAFESHKDRIAVEFSFVKTADITDVERTIEAIFEEIQNGPIPELRDKKIVNAFKKAQNSQFEINVIATMSAGKSTLINALLGKRLMPSANSATTATIFRIIDTPRDKWSAIAYDESNQVVAKFDDINLEDMKKFNNDAKVSLVEIKGKIPFVESVGMKLVLVDTPGPNNARDKSHGEMTYRMISNSDNSLVLYVMDSRQLGINDEKILLDYVCRCMKEGGKQSRDRFIFAVNQMDLFKPKDDGVDCIKQELEKVKMDLEDRGIYTPNIFPVSALAALEKRTDDDEPMALDIFRRSAKKYETFHFEDYYQYSNLPQSVRKRIEEFEAKAKDDELIEIHTGILSIEQAISQYVNKYARTTKVYDLVQAFNVKLNELSVMALLEDAIRKDKNAKAALERQVSQIKAKIASAESAKKCSERINSIDLEPVIKQKITSYTEDVKNKLNKMMTGYSNKIKKEEAIKQCKLLEKECQSIKIQIIVEIDKILQNAYIMTLTKIVEEYKTYLEELNIGDNTNELTINAVKLVSSDLPNLSSIIEENTETVDESYTKTETKEVPVPAKRIWWKPWTWFSKDHMETQTTKITIPNDVDYVDMNKVASDFITPIQRDLVTQEKGAIDYVKTETSRLKDALKVEFDKITGILKEKLEVLSKVEEDNDEKAAEIAQKEKNLEWLENIQKRVNDIIEF